MKPLVAVLKDNDNEVRLAATVALRWLGDPGALEPLVAVLEDSDSRVRQRAVTALEQLGDSRVVQPLVAVLGDHNSRVRLAAAAALISLGWQPMDETQSALLAVAQQDWDRAVSLGSTALEPLVAILRYDDSRVRQQAAIALGKFGDARLLIEVLRNGNSDVSLILANILGEEIGDAALKDYLQAAEDAHRRAILASGFTAALPPPRIRKDTPINLQDYLGELERWALANKKDASRDTLAFWALKLPAIFASASAAVWAYFQIPAMSVICSAIASFCILIDGINPRGTLRNTHHRAYHDIRMLMNHIADQYRSRSSPTTAEDTSRKLIEDAEDERRRIASYIRDAETALTDKLPSTGQPSK